MMLITGMRRNVFCTGLCPKLEPLLAVPLLAVPLLAVPLLAGAIISCAFGPCTSL